MSCGRLNVSASMADGVLTVGGISMHTPGWIAVDVTPLWDGADVRGEDLLIPGRAGLLAMPRRFTGTTYTIPLLIDGAVNSAGSPHGNVRNGILTNLDVLKSLPGGMPKAVTLTRPGGGQYGSGSAHVQVKLGGMSRGIARAAMTLDFPGGGL